MNYSKNFLAALRAANIETELCKTSNTTYTVQTVATKYGISIIETINIVNSIVANQKAVWLTGFGYQEFGTTSFGSMSTQITASSSFRIK